MLARAENVLLFELFNLITYVRKDDFTCVSMNRVIYDYEAKIDEKEYEEILETVFSELEARNDPDISTLGKELYKEVLQYNRFRTVMSLSIVLFREDGNGFFKVYSLLDPDESYVYDSAFDYLHYVTLREEPYIDIGYYRRGISILCESVRTIVKNDTLLKSEELKKDILQVIMDSGGDIFNINASLIQSSLLSLPEMRYLIIKSALEELLSERSFVINGMIENDKKYLLYYITMLLMDCGRFGSLERELLIKTCIIFQVDTEYINEFESLLIQKLKVAKQLNDINDELETLINE